VEIEKKTVVAAPIERVWAVLLDPKIMAGCVPGVQSVDVLSDTEYLAEIRVKISFISAKFKIKTKILESRPPHYLRCEGTGEDLSVASSMKQASELFLTEQPDGGTEIRITSKTDVFGRLGSFGLSVMKIKSDRMWEEYAANLAAVLRQDQCDAGIAKIAPMPDANGGHAAESAVHAAGPYAAARGSSGMDAARSGTGFANRIAPAKSTWWRRITGQQDRATVPRLPTDIYIEVYRGNDVIRVMWPASAPTEVAIWLKEIMRQ